MPNHSSASDPHGIFTRTIDLLGEEGFSRLQKAFVVAIGMGGVGSHAAVALARAGVGKIRLIDFDPVTASSLNRHAVATLKDIGRPKVDVLSNYLKAINPDIEVDTLQEFFHLDTAEKLLSGTPDFVADSIDSLNPKVTLMRYCLEHGIPIASSMGASGRTDPTQIHVADISDTIRCPLARAVRKRLRRQGIYSGVPVVYSTEAPGETFDPDEEDASTVRGRVRRRLPSISTMPGIFGYALASVIIKKLSAETE